MLDNNDKCYHEYTDEEIVANVTKGIEEIDKEDDDVITQDVTHAQACEALETVSCVSGAATRYTVWH